MTNPFDILPPNIFDLFTTQGQSTLQRHYIAILLRIYALAEFNRSGITPRAAGGTAGAEAPRVSVKATTTEEMGFTGRRDGLAAQAIVSVQLPA